MAQIMKLFTSYLGPAVDNNLNLGAGTARWTEFFLTGNITTAGLIIATSLSVQRFILSTTASAGVNATILTSNAANLSSGDSWFQSSSNVMYLFVRSATFNYYVAMNT